MMTESLHRYLLQPVEAKLLAPLLEKIEIEIRLPKRPGFYLRFTDYEAARSLDYGRTKANHVDARVCESFVTAYHRVLDIFDMSTLSTTIEFTLISQGTAGAVVDGATFLQLMRDALNAQYADSPPATFIVRSDEITEVILQPS